MIERPGRVIDLAAFLDRMEAQVVARASTIESKASKSSCGRQQIMADRIEAGTLLMACGIVGGEIELVGTRLEHLEIVVSKLCEMGMRVSQTSDGLWALAAKRLAAIDVATLPHPGFATDFMPLAVALMSVSEGSAIVTENIYDGRFQFVDELVRMGADVRNEGRHAIVRGVERLSGAPVTASDVRRLGAGAGRTRRRRRDDRARREHRTGLLRPRRPVACARRRCPSASTTDSRSRRTGSTHRLDTPRSGRVGPHTSGPKRHTEGLCGAVPCSVLAIWRS